MFKKAKYKLTATYLAIIMAITLTFSSFVYANVVRVTSRALDTQQRRIEIQFRQFIGPLSINQPMPRPTSPETLKEIREKTLLSLIGINLVIFAASAAVGFYLAGRTLKPIEEMVNKQKRFISDAAHELKTPLTAMKTDLEVTLRDKKLSVSEAKDSLKSTIEEVDKLNGFTNRLLDQGKYQNAEYKKLEKLDLKALIEASIKNLKPLADTNKQTIYSDLKSVNVMGDEVSLKQLFTNLIENALKYGGKNKNIYIKALDQATCAVVEVRDEGVGIAEKDIPQIFEPFFRAEKSRTKSNVNGYGLGLAISKEIAENHNGTIEVSSKVGKGTTFTVKLPLSRS